jgi:hypothetical protein
LENGQARDAQAAPGELIAERLDVYTAKPN